MLAMAAMAAPFDFADWKLLGQETVACCEPGFDPYAGPPVDCRVWKLQVLPEGLIYHPYLAGPKESRTGIQFFSEKNDGWSWDASVGGQLAILRYGTEDAFVPLGIQFDVEGSAQLRGFDLKLLDLLSTDVRLGFPLTIGWGNQETKLAFYLLHSHPHFDFFDSQPQPPEQLFERRAFVLGHAIHPLEQLRIYGELGYAFVSNTGGDWEFQFGAEFAPRFPTTFCGAPFAAINAYLLETDSFKGILTAQLGWAWRGKGARLLRIGGFYQNGTSNSFAFSDRNEQQFGFGFWHDF